MPREKTIIFLPEVATLPDGFQNMVDSLSGFTATEVVRAFSYLRRWLLPQTNRPRPIVVAVAPTRGDLEGLLEFKEIFEDTRLILLLADTDAETVSLGHLMRPRFIGYIGNGFGEIPDIVRKMVGWSNSGKSIRERRFCE